jgi:hypothetical protein
MYVAQKLIVSKSEPLHWLDLPLTWTLDNGQLHVNGKPARGSRNKAGARYIKHPDSTKRFPVAYVVLTLATRQWPEYGAVYRDNDPDNNHITNLMPATKDEAARHTDNQRLTREDRSKGNANQDHSATMKDHWRAIRGTDEEAARHDGLNRRKAMTVEWALSFCADMEAMAAEGKRISKKAKRTWDRARIIVLAAETHPPGLSVLLPPNPGEANF